MYEIYSVYIYSIFCKPVIMYEYRCIQNGNSACCIVYIHDTSN